MPNAPAGTGTSVWMSPFPRLFVSKLSSKLVPLFEEARRRRLFRVVVLYVLVGLATLEGAGNLGSALNFPGWTNTLVALVVLAGFPVAILVGWFFDFTASGFVRTDPAVTAVPMPIRSGTPLRGAVQPTADYPVVRRSPDRKSIAVLPFVDMSPDGSQEYFGDGIAEEIINSLTRIEDLRVLARTSSFAFKGKEAQVQEIGAQLGVGCLVEGSVRTVGDQVRITAQLIDCEHGYHLWSERYDRDMSDVFAIQDEVARAIVDTLKAKLGESEESIVRPGTANLEAYTLYLQGRYHWNRRTASELEKGITLFRKAIAIDDRYGLAWAGLADSYSILGWYRHLSSIEAYTKTVSAASSAVAVDDSLAEPHTSLAYARFMYGWDWRGAEEGFRAALERNPDYAVARHWFGEFLMAMGRFDEALEQLDMAHALDPLSPTIGFGVGWVQYFLGDYRAAIRRYEKTLVAGPGVRSGSVVSRSRAGAGGRVRQGDRRMRKRGSPACAARTGLRPFSLLLRPGRDSAMTPCRRWPGWRSCPWARKWRRITSLSSTSAWVNWTARSRASTWLCASAPGTWYSSTWTPPSSPCAPIPGSLAW